ncbi:MAG: hypothetical protein AAGI37_19745 [Planctomycetota bacterium]
MHPKNNVDDLLTVMAIANTPVQAAQMQVMYLYAQTADYPPDSLAHVIQHAGQMRQALEALCPVQGLVVPAYIPADGDDEEWGLDGD